MAPLRAWLYIDIIPKWVMPEGNQPIFIHTFDVLHLEDARNEAQVLRVAARLSALVPELYRYLDSNDVPGAPFLITDRADLQSLEQMWPQMAHAQQVIWIETLANTLLKLHTTKPTQDWLQTQLAPLEYAERHVHWWQNQAKRKADQTAQHMLSWLRSNMYLARDVKFRAPIHRLFQPENVLCEGQDIRQIIRWHKLTIGDPAVDAAWTAMILTRSYNAEAGKTFINAYLKRNPDAAKTLPFWQVFSGAKQLVLFAERRLAGHMVNEEEEARVIDFAQHQINSYGEND
jgi:aminoglycoside phosphotransferase (APT) family kinase protein